ncbi:PH domain-containing protein [Actinomadura rugatobispora]|uniref:PH domain-containing protein n=1 Tax=Actinomadura rugatobispora TaxID=1994 RepID=A0ABW1A9K9_9ACTN|nr:hypothetical protein GCM10010200_053650 [Actinomadura rugatobispora]
MITPDQEEPLALRPSYRHLILVVLIYVLVNVGLIITDRGMLVLLSPLYLPLSIAIALGPGIITLSGSRGRTTVDASGVTRTKGGTEQHIPWDEIERISFTGGALGMGFVLVLVRRGGGRLILPAPAPSMFARERSLAARLEPIYARAGTHRPRVASQPVQPGARRVTSLSHTMTLAVLTGVSVLTLYLASPWTQAWWPGREEAVALPTACSVADKATVARLVPNARPPKSVPPGRPERASLCSFRTADPFPTLSIALVLEERGLGLDGGATERLRDSYAKRSCPARLPGIGDDACLTIKNVGDVRTTVGVSARKNNIHITVEYYGTAPTTPATEETIRLTRAALDGIPFE